MKSFIRLNVIAEGQTEEHFVKDTLAGHLSNFNVDTRVRCVLTSKDKYKNYRGGLISYQKAKLDICTWLKSDPNEDARFTTMFDLYALPDDFPGNAESRKANDPYIRVSIIEKAMKEDIDDRRFIPYIQLHEFETFLFVSPDMLKVEYFNHEKSIARLNKIRSEFDNNAELINDGDKTAPSKRIIQLIPEYSGSKVNVGAAVAGMIGIDTLRTNCRHFNDWLKTLESHL